MSLILSSGTLISTVIWLISLPVIGFALRFGEFPRTAPIAVFAVLADLTLRRRV